MTAPQLYTTPEAADILSVSAVWLKRQATAQALPHTRIGRRVRWSEANLAAIVANGQAGPARLRRAS